MDVVRYRPDEAVRWLQMGAANMRLEARRQTSGIILREGERTIARDLKDAAGAIFGMGKSAWAELVHDDATATQYVLRKDRLEIVRSGGTKTVRYKDVVSMRQRGDRLTLVLKSGSAAIKPHAHVVSGRVKVPIGWSRDGLQVPYETLLDELSARCGIEIEYA